MDAYGENPRGEHALRVLLPGRTDFNVQRLIDAAYDSYLPGFEDIVPALVAAWDGTANSDPLKARLAGPVAALRGWGPALRGGIDPDIRRHRVWRYASLTDRRCSGPGRGRRVRLYGPRGPQLQ